MKLSIPAFSGRIPRVSNKKLPPGNAQVAKDCDLRSGELRPFRQSALVKALGAGTIGTIHRWYAGEDEYWLQFPSDVDVINAPLADDVYQRIYWTGDSRFTEPRMSYTGPIQNGGTAYPVTSYKWGVPAPEQSLTVSIPEVAAITITDIQRDRPMVVTTQTAHGFRDGELVDIDIVSADPAEGEQSLMDYLNGASWSVRVLSATQFEIEDTDGNSVLYSAFTSGTVQKYVENEVLDPRTYVHTYVTALGEEGPPSDPTEEVLATAFQTPDIEIPTINPTVAEGRLIDKVRIYRASAGTAFGQFQFVAEIPISQNTYQDAELRLGETISSTIYDPPPVNLQGVKMAAQGFAVGFYDNVVCFSEPFLPHAWPTNYQIPLDYDIVSLEVIDNGVVVGTTGRPYLIQGIDPRSMTPRRLELNYACVSKRSMVSMGYAAIYASREGLVYVGRDGARLLTESILTEIEWADFQPETLYAFELNGRYVGFYGTQGNGAGFFIEPRKMDAGLVDLSLWTKAGYRDPRNQFLYYLDDTNQILRWNDPGQPEQPYEWLSGVGTLPRPANMGFYKATMPLGGAGVTTFELYADGDLKHGETIAPHLHKPLPAGYQANEFEMRFTGTAHVQSLDIAESSGELAT